MADNLFIGLISGTSIDAVDCVLVCFNSDQCQVIGEQAFPIPPKLRNNLAMLTTPGADNIDLLGACDVGLGKLMAEAVNDTLLKNSINARQVTAIGSHGQTVRHRPEINYTLQIGDPNIVALETGIKTIADFRRKDMACGGQGAPLVPPFHQRFFSASATMDTRIIVNIGGIANLTILNQQDMTGFDCGPGNTLLDQWIEKHQSKHYDDNGAWARQGTVNKTLLDRLMRDPYFQLTGPKSTGREYFNLAWLQPHLQGLNINPNDVQRTLLEFSALTIAESIRDNSEFTCPIFICGGGAHNGFLLERITTNLPGFTIRTTDQLGIPVDNVEACAFAWLAKQYIDNKPTDITRVTGANRSLILGVEYLPY